RSYSAIVLHLLAADGQDERALLKRLDRMLDCAIERDQHPLRHKLRLAAREQIDSAFDHIHGDRRPRMMLLELRALFRSEERHVDTVAFDEGGAMAIAAGPRRLALEPRNLRSEIDGDQSGLR